MRFIILLILLLLPSPLLAQDWATLNSRGLEYYNNGDYILADSLLQKALNPELSLVQISNGGH